MPGHGSAVEAQQAGDAAHGNAPPNLASRVNPSASAPPTMFSLPISTQAWAAERAALTRDAEAKRGSRCRAGAAWRARPARAADTAHSSRASRRILDGPGYPIYFVGGEAPDAPRRPVRPRKDARGRNKAHREPRQDEHDRRLAQIDAPHRPRRHRASLRSSAAVIGSLSLNQNAINRDVQSCQAPLQCGTHLSFPASGHRKRPLQRKPEFCGRRGWRLRFRRAGAGRLRCVAMGRFCFAADCQHGQRRGLPRAPLCCAGTV